MARLIPAALIASVIALVLIAGLVDSIIGGEWDHFAVFLIALGLVTFLIARTRRTRPTVTLRKDLNHWVTDYSNRTGQTVEVTLDRAVAGHRRRVAPTEGHTALLETDDRTHNARGSRETRARASTATSDDDDESVCVVLDGTGTPTSVAGGKGAALDRLIAIDIPTPATGVITTSAYRRFVSESDLEVWLDDLISAGVPEPSRMSEVAAAVDERFLATPMAPDLENAILDLARTIRGDDGRLAVRSSATAEDQDAASFAGQYASFLEIEDDASVLRSVRLVWASLWHPAPLAYREHRGIGHDVAMAVVVMRLVEAEHAGVLFTIDPGGEADHLRIEHVPGLAEGLVSGAVTPEALVIPRSGPIPEQEDGPPLGDVVALALRVEEAFGAPISRAVLDRRRRALETARLVGPLPRLFSGRPDRVEVAVAADGDIVTGWAASPGLYRGRVRIITDIATTPSLEPGDILVARATDPSWTPLFLTAGALIVEEGGPLSHAAIVARELGLPAVLNIEGITGLLVDGEEVTVDGTAGRILLHRGENLEVAA
ncbi:MAG: hypothetical protein IH942_07875 [Acidobacteria bacterium]|nr:hypothetical protein [Acidobacteriota bacterium]